MKKLSSLTIMFILSVLFLNAQNISINSNGDPADASAMLDISSTAKGLLIPRISLQGVNDATTIATPAASLLVYNLGTGGATPLTPAGYYYNSGTSGSPVWTKFSTGTSGWGLAGNTLTAGTLPDAPVEWLGTINAADLVIKTNNTMKLRISTKGQLETFGTPQNNIFIGEGAGELLSTGVGSVFIGHEAGYNSDNPDYTVAVGYHALYTNTTGDNNTAIGYNSMGSRATVGSMGLYNTAVGANTLSKNTNKFGNTAIGNAAMFNNITGTYNVAVGYNALLLDCGDYNVAIGFEALDATTSAAAQNTATGKSALGSTTSGTYNTAFGANALLYNETGTYNTAIGWMAGPPSGSVALTNTSAIGNGASVTTSNNIMFGNTAVVGWGFGYAPTAGTDAIRVGNSTSNGNGARLTLTGVWTDGSDSTKKYNITDINYGLNEVMKLHPVNYMWKGTDKKDFGFLAQEVKNILPEIVYGEEGQMTLSYGHITSVLVKGMQEQQIQIAEQQKQIEELKLKNNNLETINENLKTELDLLKIDYNDRINKLENILNVKAEK